MKNRKRPSRLKLQVRKVTPLSPRFVRAFRLAARLHAGQGRKGTEVPYLAHLMGVASLVLEAGGDEDLAIAALLHDAVEDCGGQPTLRLIRRQFGSRVARVVEECTDADTLPKPPWRERKQRYLAHLPQASADGRLVSAADKLHNARAILTDYRLVGDGVWDRFKGGRDGTLWYYRALVETFRRLGTNRVVEELARTVEELERAIGNKR
ncbi:MAG TPA: HD domain-containing protein [Terriglobales bacterium]|nr:HD domain-containing protein [Terriglobales bacterium]